MKTTPSSHPTTEQQNHLERIQELEKQNQELQALVDWYKEQFRLKQHQKFGASSEKSPDGQMELPLFNEAEMTASESAEEPEVETEVVERKKPQKRKTLSKDLPVETITYTLPEEEQACLSCGHELHVMKKEIRRELIIIPAEVKVLQHEREVYSCRQCEREDVTTPIVQAPMPNSVIPKSMASPSSISHILVQKFMAAVPLYRQEKQFEQIGVPLSRQTMSNWILFVADEWLRPIYQHMRKALLNQSIIHIDETTVQVLDEKGRSPSSKSYMWVYCSGREGPPCVLYDYQTTRASKHPKAFLDNYKRKITVDGYQAYDGLPGVTVSGCWAHARRKFDEAKNAAPPSKEKKMTLAQEALHKIGELYKIEKNIADLDTETRLTIRQEQSLPLVEAYFTWLKKIKPQVLPKSPLGEAISYSLNQQKKLRIPFTDGLLDIDNNRAERCVKPFVVGRKNWLFSKSPKGATSSATIYSVVETAKENNLNVFNYLVHLFETMPNIDKEDPNHLEQLLPWSESLPDRCYIKRNNN